MVWGVLLLWLVNFSGYKDLLGGHEWYPVVVWALVILVFGVIASLLTIRWSLFFLYLSIVVGGIGLMVWLDWLDASVIFLPAYSVFMSIIGFLLVELYRRSHKYIISNLRIKFKGGVITKTGMTVGYEKISNIVDKQGVLGQIFDFGTLIPISESGLGLGSDQSLAAGGVGIGGKKAKLFGLVGGGKEVKTPRTRSYFELHGVYPFKEVKKKLEELYHQKGMIVPYEQEQVAFQKEQVDIQKQMRDLLKKQTGTKGEETEEKEET